MNRSTSVWVRNRRGAALFSTYTLFDRLVSGMLHEHEPVLCQVLGAFCHRTLARQMDLPTQTTDIALLTSRSLRSAVDGGCRAACQVGVLPARCCFMLGVVFGG